MLTIRRQAFLDGPSLIRRRITMGLAPRTPSKQKGAALGAAVALSISVFPAHAEVSVANLSYRVDAGCPAEGVFLLQVRSRSVERAVALAVKDGPQDLAVTIASTGDHWLGTLAVPATPGGATVRQVEGASCEEVATALALITALTLESGGVLTTHPPSSTEPKPPSEHSAVLPERPRPSAPRADTGPRTQWQFGAGGRMAGGVASVPVPGLRVLAGLGHDDNGIAWSVRLSYTGTLAGSETKQWGTASSRLDLFSVQGCAWRWPSMGALSLRPCASVEAGILHAAGTASLPDAGSSGMQAGAVLDGALAGRVEWHLGGALALEADAEAALMLFRQNVVVDRQPGAADAEAATLLYEMPLVAGRVGMGLVARLP